MKSIVENFEKVHGDLQSLKGEYIQQLTEVPSNATQEFVDGSDEDVQLSSKLFDLEHSNMAMQISSKQRQMAQIVQELDKAKQTIQDDALVQQLDEDKKLGMRDLLQIEDQISLELEQESGI